MAAAGGAGVKLGQSTRQPHNEERNLMYIEIHHNTAEGLSEHDRNILLALAGVSAEPTATVTTKPVADDNEKPKATKKAAPAAKKTRAKKEAEPEPDEAEEADEDLLGGDDDDEDGPTMADAVALATKLVNSGDSSKVKEALNDLGVKRVSELKGDAIATFVNGLRED